MLPVLESRLGTSLALFLFLVVCSLSPLSGAAEMTSRSTSVTLTAVLPEQISVVASPAAGVSNNDQVLNTTPFTITTSWITNPRRSSISVYLEDSVVASHDVQVSGSSTRHTNQPLAEAPLFVQRLTEKNRNATRVDHMNAPVSIQPGLVGRIICLRVQTL